MAKCDLHVHSFYSGKTAHVKLLEPMDSYSTPDRIYRIARGRDMDLVTITDHDSIDGCLSFLDKHPHHADFFISEEVSVPLPQYDYSLHIGVYNISEENHHMIRKLRADLDALLCFLAERNIFFVWNHPFFRFPLNANGKKLLEFLLPRFVAYEGINASLPPVINTVFLNGIQKYLNKRPSRSILTAGSDAHSLIRIGSAWTEAPGSTPDAFFASLREGKGNIHGNIGRFTGVFQDAMSVYLGYFRDITVRNEVHTHWSRWKKIRNGAGWAAWLPVFTIGSFLYAWLQFRSFRHQAPGYRRLFDDICSETEPGRVETKRFLIG